MLQNFVFESSEDESGRSSGYEPPRKQQKSPEKPAGGRTPNVIGNEDEESYGSEVKSRQAASQSSDQESDEDASAMKSRV